MNYFNRIQKENYLRQDYVSSYPKWMRFYIFLRRGLFRGGLLEKIVWKRIFCWFDLHSIELWPKDEYRGCYISCRTCGLQEHDL